MGRNQLLYTAAEEPVLYFVLRVYVEHTKEETVLSVWWKGGF